MSIRIYKGDPYIICDVCALTTFAGRGTEAACEDQAIDAGWKKYKQTTLVNKRAFLTSNTKAAYRTGPHQHVCPGCFEFQKKPSHMGIGLFKKGDCDEKSS